MPVLAFGVHMGDWQWEKAGNRKPEHVGESTPTAAPS